jgi:hypothetical protein
MKYYDNAQLIEERRSYDFQIKSFEIEVQHIWDVLDMIYEESKFLKGVVDFNDLANKKRNKIRNRIKMKTGDPVYEDIDKMWDEITFMKAQDTDVEKMNRTYIFEKDKIKKKLILMSNKLLSMFGYSYPKKRRVMEERLQFLESEFQMFDYKINPYHIQPGLLLDVDITSIKKKKATLDGMANVLNEFLHGVSKGFQDAAFASFSRRRSTVREDIAQSFAGSDGGGPKTSFEPAGETTKSDALDVIPETSSRSKSIVRSSVKRGKGAPTRGGKGKGGRSRGSGLSEI